ncbi:MAG: DUF3107 domain-containing protein [Micrococcaceae bacterium]
MEIKIGIQNTARELVIDTNEDKKTIEEQVTKQLSEELLRVKDAKGNTTLVPTKNISYIELETAAPRKVGFGAALN